MDIRNNKYYVISGDASSAVNYPADLYIRKYGAKASKILDIGCGEGTRLNLIPNKIALKVGVDISRLAIDICKKKYPNIQSEVVGIKLPYENNFFDFVYSAFVLEHTNQTEEFIKEAVRVLSKNGTILFVAPNFGSPNRQSPNGTNNRYRKIVVGFVRDIKSIFLIKSNKLNWKKVIPQKIYTVIDADTTIEPYLLNLEKYMSFLGIEKIKIDSLWSQEISKFGIQSILKLLSRIKIYPFYYWGPHMLYIGRKI